MEWMGRLFEELSSGQYPRLVDLPTGAGKTELVTVWLLALAWYGLNRTQRKEVPRRLVWVVNRRVLVQQVVELAEALREKLHSGGLEDVQNGLANVSGKGTGKEQNFFSIVELRGQVLADSEWAIQPSLPQLIVGTVDQIGSRLLFQGYGLGKWGRPQQAGMLGVDSWVAIDEAHLVPAFVLTLRQLRERCASSTDDFPSPLNAIFARLPFWLTELSATPGLPPPSEEHPFRLTDSEKTDPRIADRVLAAHTRLVSLKPLPKADKPKEKLIEELVTAASRSDAARVAVFVREAGVADKVAEGLRKAGISKEHICKVTGRIRGYERDRLTGQKAFQVFLSERSEPIAEPGDQPYFLIGTAAAEVGLDADADMILCDFASLPTLLQRLGRLDRRGVLSRRHANKNCDAPRMLVFAPYDEPKPKSLAMIQGQLSQIANAIEHDAKPYSPKLMAGTHWRVDSNTADKDNDAADTGGEKEQEKSAKQQTTPLIDAATWSVLNPKDGSCSSPNEWLKHRFAKVAAGPVVVPPLTDAVLDYWSATTESRNPYLSPHPFLYGLLEEEEGTPLVGVAFRLEVEALREAEPDDDDPELPDTTAEVLEIFERFPPLRAELHQVKLSTLRDWLASPEAVQQPLVYRNRDQWRAKKAGESGSETARALGPNSTLILPAAKPMQGKGFDSLLKDCQESIDANIVISDVLEGVSTRGRIRYLRTIEPRTGRVGADGAWLWTFDANDQDVPIAMTEGYKRSLLKKLRIGGTEYTFRYLYPKHADTGLQFLDEHNGSPGHLQRAENEGIRIAEAIAPGDPFLRTLLSNSARLHDEGKRHPKWQRAFGRRRGEPEIAKLVPELQRPGSIQGFRHEWESLRKAVKALPAPSPDIPSGSQSLWQDLSLHLVGVHHGHLRPSIVDEGLTPDFESSKQNSLRLDAAERFIRLQKQLGRWRLAYLEALLKTADAEGSRSLTEEEPDGI